MVISERKIFGGVLLGMDSRFDAGNDMNRRFTSVRLLEKIEENSYHNRIRSGEIYVFSHHTTWR